MKKKTSIFASELMPLDEHIDIVLSEPLGLTAKVFVHEIARKLPIYNKSIKCKDKGLDKNGKKIAINTAGRWLFGVPGYGGHTRITSVGDDVVIYFPKKSQKVIYELVASIKEAMEIKK